MTDRITVTPDAVDPAEIQAKEEAAIKALADRESQLQANGNLPNGGDTTDGAEGEDELILGKFKSQEDLEKAYTELSKKLGQQSGQESGQDSGEESGQTPEGEQEIPDEEVAKEAVTEAGLDFDALSTEYAQNGELSQESYDKLDKAGIPKEVVDNYIAGQQAVQDSQAQEVYDTVGGQEKYAEMVQWAEKNLPKSDQDAFNDAVDSGDMSRIKLAVRGLKASFDDGKPFVPLQGDGGGGSVGAAYESWAQVRADMAKPEYHADPAFRRQVEQKLSRSKI